MPAACLNKVVAYVRRLADGESRGRTDRQLLARFTRERDESSFAELVRRHGPMVLATCRRVLRHEQDAEDAFQAAFLVLARKSASIREHDSVGGWLYQVAYRLALRARTLGRRHSARFTAFHIEPAASEPDTSHEALCTALGEELALLPESYRAAIVLCYLEGKTQGEAALLLATTTDAVNSRLKRARELLRHRLARHGLVLSAAALAEAFAAGSAPATPALIAHTARVAVQFATHSVPAAGASAAAVALAKGALQTMIPAKSKLFGVLALVLALFTSGALLMPSSAQEDPAALGLRAKALRGPKICEDLPTPKKEIAPKPRRCIIVWLSGGPSQIDTFDPKAGKVALFKAIDTNVKGVQFSETLPLLAKQANHLAILRGVSHRDGDHGRGGYLMRTGFAAGGADYPTLGCVLGKELGDDAGKLPRYVCLGQQPFYPVGPGFLGPKYAPLIVDKLQGFGPPQNADLRLPDVEAFEALDKDKGAAMRKAVAKAFDLGAEKAAARDAYGRGRFGNGCLLARRLIEAGVPVVEISQGGWDTHGDAEAATKKLCTELDAGLAALIKDLHERKLLDSTLIVCMGEFGRTPRINAAKGRDHWPSSFSVVLAGGGIKGGQAIGKTSADATKIEEGQVSPQELLATVYTALAIDPHKKNRAADGTQVPLVERGNSAVKAALR